MKKELGFTWDLHSLRYAFITKLRNANIPERVVAHYVGHTQKSITDRYTSFTKEFVDSSVQATDFGSEFLNDSAHVVPMRSPNKKAVSEVVENKTETALQMVAGPGLVGLTSDRCRVSPHHHP